MASKELFGSAGYARQTVNRAGGAAYDPSAEEKLAQYACTGMFGGTYYVNAKEQVDECAKLAANADPFFVARCAVYARREAGLKDVPAFLLAVLNARAKDPQQPMSIVARQALRDAFPRVINDGRMLRNFAQIVRSGVTGRKNFGHTARGLVNAFITRQSPERLLNMTVGESPSLKDVIKMTRPKIGDALGDYLIGKWNGDPETTQRLPDAIVGYELFKLKRGEVPDVDFRLLDSLKLTDEEWNQVALRAPFRMTLKNLNTFARHGVFFRQESVNVVGERLSNRDNVEGSRVYPYEIMAAFKHADESAVPAIMIAALNQAMEHATRNVPRFEGLHVVVCPDVSGSMRSPVTGARGAATSKMRYVDVAALVGATLMRVSERCTILPFDTNCYRADQVISKDIPILSMAGELAAHGGGGTQCELPLIYLNRGLHQGIVDRVDLVVYVSDNESWYGRGRTSFRSTTTMDDQWKQLKSYCPKAKLVCIDIAPATTHQVQSAPDVLNVGGFNDAVWKVVNRFVIGGGSFVDTINAVEL